jgi:hypothetical protein
VAVLLEVLLDLQSRHAAGSRRRDRLPVPPVLDVAASEDPRNPGEDIIVRLDIPVLIQIELPGKHRRIRNMPDAKKEPADAQLRLDAGLRVEKPNALDLLVLE